MEKFEEIINELIKFINDNFIESTKEIDQIENYKLLIDYIYKKEIEINDFIADALLNLCPKLYSLVEYLSTHTELISSENISVIVEVFTFRKEQEYLTIEQMKRNKIFKIIKEDKSEEIDGDLDLIDMYLNEINFEVLSQDEEIELSRRIKSGDSEAFEKLVNHNLRLVIKWAKYYQNRGLSLLDLIQAGNEGLLKAAKRFDGSKGTKFSTYASWWIQQSISYSLAYTSRNIRIPKDWTEESYKIKAFIKKYVLEYGINPTIEEISNALGYEVKKIEKIMMYLNDTISLYGSTSEQDETQLITSIKDDNDIDEVITYNILKEKIYEVLDELLEKDREVIMLRYGLYDGHIYTLREIGLMFNVTQGRIREREARALKKLRHPSVTKRLRGFLEK